MTQQQYEQQGAAEEWEEEQNLEHDIERMEYLEDKLEFWLDPKRNPMHPEWVPFHYGKF